MPQKQFSVLQIFTISSKLFVVNGNGELKKKPFRLVDKVLRYKKKNTTTIQITVMSQVKSCWSCHKPVCYCPSLLNLFLMGCLT